VLLATVRADLLRHVTEGEALSHSALRSSLRDFVDDTLDSLAGRRPVGVPYRASDMTPDPAPEQCRYVPPNLGPKLQIAVFVRTHIANDHEHLGGPHCTGE